MLIRLTHAAIAFAVTVAAYQAYVLVAVPFVEPAARAAAFGMGVPSIDELLAGSGGSTTHRTLLAAYFAADHWCLDPKVRPIIIENGQAMIVLDKYEQSKSGALNVPRCVVLFFPRSRDRADLPPRDVVVLEPERGAMLQLDQTLGAGFGGMGRMQYGQLLGAVHVRSDMREPGPHDDLAIDTRDLYMNEDLIRTTGRVEIRLGDNHASGRGLEIRFLRTETPQSQSGNATLFGKLETLEITHEVAALVVPKQTTLFGQTPTPAPQTGSPRQPGAPPTPPAQITSDGPFRIDFGKRVASFSENVQVRQRQPDGKIDELVAELLTLYFAEMREWGGDVTPTPADGSLFGSVKLEPATVEAIGGEGKPVRLNAPSHGAVARGDRLTIGLIARQVTLEGGDDLLLTYRGAEVHAPVVRYELPPKDSTSRIGGMFARGGGGWLKATPNATRPNEVLEVRWTDSMQLVRRAGQPVLILDGRPRVSMAGLGTLWADQLEIFLRENARTSNDPASTTAAASVLPAAVEAERIVATGHVGIESAELNGKVNQLELKITNPPQAAVSHQQPGGAVEQPGPAAPFPNSNAQSLFARNSAAGPRRAYNIAGSVLQLEAVMRDRRPQVTAIHVDGGVVFQERSLGGDGEAPLQILAEHLQVTDAETPHAKIEIRGGDSRAGLAELSARGTVLRAPELLVNRGASQAAINSPGEVQMLLTRDPSGQPLARPEVVAITWRDSMLLDRDRITFLGNVHVDRGGDWLRTRKLVAVLTAPVRFDGAGGEARDPEVAQLECWEGAVAEFDQRDAAGAVTSHNRLEVVSLVVNQVTGEIRGDGPGHVDSVHLSKKGSAALALPTAPGQRAPEPTIDPNAPPQLRHLSIDFVRNFEGNLHARWIAVAGDVKTIYGPVDKWDQRLSMTPDGRPGPDTIWISCDRLKANESPYGRMQTPTVDGRRPMGPIELSAEGGVEIEVEHPEKGAFNLRGEGATYDQLKTMFKLSGNNRSLATITNQPYPGAPPSEQTAEGFIYFQNTGEIKLISPRGQAFQFDAK